MRTVEAATAQAAVADFEKPAAAVALDVTACCFC